jgi:hypothetical protein
MELPGALVNQSGSDYESGGQEFESLRARQHLAQIITVKIRSWVRHGYGQLATKI